MTTGANLAVLGEGLWEQQPDEKKVGEAEGQGNQSGVLVEEFSPTGVDCKVGPHQRSYGEAQREGNADHSLTTYRNTFTSMGWFSLLFRHFELELFTLITAN